MGLSKRFASILAVVVGLGLAATIHAQPSFDSLSRVRGFLEARAAQLGLAATDFEDLVVTDSYVTRHNGVRHIYFRQRVAGIEVTNSATTLSFDAEGKLLHFADRLVPGLQGKVTSLSPELDQAGAIQAAAEGLGLEIAGPIERIEIAGGPALEEIYRVDSLSLEPVPVELRLYATSADEVRLAWETVIHVLDQQHIWNLWIDAENGEILARADWVAQDTYEVYALPKESPTDGPRTIEVDPADATGSPFGWHDTDGSAGAEFTDTRGNNVFAQEDVDGNNFGGSRPDGGAGLDFTAPIDFNDEPSDYQDAAIINLFYWNNIIHDILYEYGFDEPSGNFQENNYGNGGAQGDPVQADAQDGSGVNNANFSTPADGADPRMQMFVWLAPPELEVNSPVSIAGTYLAGPASFGQFLDSTGLTGNLELVDDGTAMGSEGCNALVGFTAGRVAVIDRGSCEFGLKVRNAQDAGALAGIVVNNQGDDVINMGGGVHGPFVTIPSVFIGQSDGALIKGELPGVNATMRSTVPNRDSDLDNGIIAHEYCHGLSNRLTGGPNNVGCLTGNQRAGEGWSDICTLFLSPDENDTPVTGHGVGTYVIFEGADGDGIRPSPYTTDMTVNPFTYGDIQTAGLDGDPLSIPHGVGFVWATAAWEVYWNLVSKHGFDPDVYTGTGGNNIWFQLIVDGMKLQQCSPTFVDARDAILAADVANNGGANECEIWEGFARRGLGENALDGGSSASLNVTEDFTVPAQCTNSSAPDVDIVGPDSGSVFDDGDTIDFSGFAYDIQDGDLTGSLAWTSDLFGAIGNGGSPSAMLPTGYHTVTTSVMDSGGLPGEDSSVVVVQDLPFCPANDTLDSTISGTESHIAIDTMTLGSNLLVDATGDLTVIAGNAALFLDGATIEGDLEIRLDPQPCP